MTTLDLRVNAARPELADIALKDRVSAAAYVEGHDAHVAAAHAALRRRPANDAPLETEALHGESVRIFEDPGEGWAWVQLRDDGYVGWMETEALVAGAPAAATHRVSAVRTLLFPGPDIKLPPLGALPMGATLTARGEAEDRNASYVLVAPFGAVVAQHLRPVDEPFETDFVAVAERFRSTPYLWGGRTSLGIDCSGLVQIALKMTGVPAPRDADMQETALGRSIGIGEPLERGDLVFWKGHVGIMADAVTLLHANAFHMATASEPLVEAIARAEAKGSPVTSIRRLSPRAS